MTKCALCNEEFTQISWAHLKYRHNLTVGEYRLLFPNRANDVLNSSNWKKGHIPWIKNKHIPSIGIKSWKTRRKNGNTTAWNKGLTKDIDERVAKCGNLLSKTLKTLPIWNKGLTKENDNRLLEAGEKISMSLRGRTQSNETISKISVSKKGTTIVWNKGLNKKDKRVANGSIKASKTAIERGSFRGENNPNWRGGTAYGDYGLNFNDKVKRRIRKRDNYTCQLCGIPECEYPYFMTIHHIDYTKNNNSEINLVALCRSCNSIVNGNREKWTKHFNQKCFQQIPLRIS